MGTENTFRITKHNKWTLLQTFFTLQPRTKRIYQQNVDETRVSHVNAEINKTTSQWYGGHTTSPNKPKTAQFVCQEGEGTCVIVCGGFGKQKDCQF